MRNRKFFFGQPSFRTALWLLLAVLISKAAAEPAKPNVVFILADDLGFGDIGAFYQNERRQTGDRAKPCFATPNIDAMSMQGIKLTHHYCGAAVCAPSRATLFLGVHQGHANVRDNQFDKALENNHTLGTVLKAAGYSTALFGKWGLQGTGTNPATWPAYPTKRGFDYYLGYVRHKDGHEHYPKEGPHEGPKEVWENDQEISASLDKCYTADLFTARAKKWIVDQQAAQPGRPFFAFLSFDTPHAVQEYPTQPYPAGRGLHGGLQWLGKPGKMINTAGGKVDSWCYPDYATATFDDDRDPKTSEVPWPDVYKRYATAVRRIDDCVGDVLQLLRDLHLETNTLVVFTSDNGPSIESYLKDPLRADFFDSFGPFDGIKRDLWEGGLRVPTVAWWPSRIRAGRVSAQPSQQQDWMPTFAELARVPAPARSDGVSLVPLLTEQGQQRPSMVYSEYFYKGRTPNYADFAPAHRGRVRDQMQTFLIGNYQGVRYNVSSNSENFEIYDVVNDPGQRGNRGGRPEFATLQQQMKDSVLGLRRPDPSSPRPYDNDLIPAVQAPYAESGLDYSAYAGRFPWVPELRTLPPLATGVVSAPTVEAVHRDQDIGMLFAGFLNVPRDGEYTFYLNADAGALLRLHEATVIDADFGYLGGVEKSGVVRLKAGLHPFRLYYARRDKGDPMLKLSWSGPGFEKHPVPRGAFFHGRLAASEEVR